MGIFPKFPFSQYGMPLQANHFSYRSYLLLAAADNGQVSALCLLDLTAAFDTVDHDLLMLRLERQFGLRGVVRQPSRRAIVDVVSTRRQRTCS